MNRPGIYRILTIEALYIPPENNTPEYRLYPEGIIRITGRGINETKKEVSDKIMKWIDNYLLDPADVTYVIISFEYLNSSSTAILVSIIKKISGVRLMMKKAVISPNTGFNLFVNLDDIRPFFAGFVLLSGLMKFSVFRKSAAR